MPADVLSGQVDTVLATRRTMGVAGIMARMRAGAKKIASSVGSASGASGTSSKFSAWIRGKRVQDAGASSDSKQQQKDTGDDAAHNAALAAAASGEATAVVAVVAPAGNMASRSAAVAEGRRSSSGGQDATLLPSAWGPGVGAAGWLQHSSSQAAAGYSSSRALQRHTSSLRRRRLTSDTQGTATSSSSCGQQQLEQAAALASRSMLPPQDLFPSLLATGGSSNGGGAGSLASTLFGSMPRSYVADGGGIMAAGLHEDYTWVEFLDTLAAIHGGPGSSSWRRRSSEAGSAVMAQGSRWVTRGRQLGSILPTKRQWRMWWTDVTCGDWGCAGWAPVCQGCCRRT